MNFVQVMLDQRRLYDRLEAARGELQAIKRRARDDPQYRESDEFVATIFWLLVESGNITRQSDKILADLDAELSDVTNNRF